MKTIALCCLILSILFISNCKIYVQDLTNSTQPKFRYSLSTSDFYYPSTYSQINELYENLGHYFLLEIKTQRVDFLNPSIYINGEQYTLTEYEGSDGDGLWYYQSQDLCNEKYDYYYNVEYSYDHSSEYKFKRIGSSTKPLVTEIDGFGEFLWFTRNSEYRPTELVFIHGVGTNSIYQHEVYIHNLSEGLYRITDVSILVNPEKFEISQGIEPMVELNCGDYQSFKVKWNPVFGDYDDRGVLVLAYQVFWNDEWNDHVQQIVLTTKEIVVP